MIDRRDFIGTAAASATTVLLVGCGSNLPEPGWQVSEHPTGDIRLRVLQYAILAPNSHNVQPWLIDLTSDTEMRLYVDRSRLLSASDPPARQVHISQGTFLELLDIAARQFGYKAEIRYFPEGEYTSTVVEDLPVAAVTIRPDPSATPDPLFAEIHKRYTNKRPYDIERTLSTEELAEIRSAPGTDNVSWRITDGESQRRDIAGICKEAMTIEVSSLERNRETANWFRFSDRELREKRDGFGIAQNGTEGVKKWIAETFVLSRESAVNPNGAFAQAAVTQAQEQADSASVFAALVSNTNTRLDQVLMGRAYARVHLTASRLGLAMQPLSQVLEEYPEMAPLQKRLKQTLVVTDEHTVQMLFRLGHAKPTPHTPRRDVTALIRQPAAGRNKLASIVRTRPKNGDLGLLA